MTAKQYMKAAMSGETRMAGDLRRCTRCHRVSLYLGPAGGCHGCGNPSMEPVAVIPQAEYDRLKRLEAAVEGHDVEISNFGAALTNDGRAMVQAAIRAYRAALLKAKEARR